MTRAQKILQEVQDDACLQDLLNKIDVPISKALQGLNPEKYMPRTAEIVLNKANEVAPPGFEGTVKHLKKAKGVDNPYALAWHMKNKGDVSHKKASGAPKKEAY